jgi:hypothetical protein
VKACPECGWAAPAKPRPPRKAKTRKQADSKFRQLAELSSADPDQDLAAAEATPAPSPIVPSDHPLDASIDHDKGRYWIDIDRGDASPLDAVVGDTLAVELLLTAPETGPQQRITVLGIYGGNYTVNASKRRNAPQRATARVWLTTEIDPETVEGVTVRRRRRV